jgi:hypothetical protein
MADSILGGLFGITPEAYQAQQNKEALAQSLQLGQLDPFALARTGLLYGGRQIGGAIAGALGGQDPQLQLISARNSILKGVDLNDPEALQEASIRLAQFGDMQGAYGAAELAQKRADSIATINLREAQAKRAGISPSGVSERNRELISTANTKLANNEKLSVAEESSLRAQVAQEMKPKTFESKTGEIITIQPLDIAFAAPKVAEFLKVGQPSGGTSTGAGAVNVLETPSSKEALVKEAEAKDAALSAVKDIRTTISETRKLISPYTTGYGALLSGFPASEAMTLDDNTATIKKNIALGKLREMKQESKTGASGLGALNMKEFDAIESVLGKLNPKSANYKNDLEKIDAFFARAESLMTQQSARASQTVASRVGGAPSQQQTPATQANQPAPVANKEAQIKALVDRAMADPRTKGTRQQVEAVIRSRFP